jgi:ADP-glucose pyrophosphorylase
VPFAGVYRLVDFPLSNCQRDVGTVRAYWQAHLDFLAGEPPLDLDDPAWPVYTRGGRHSAARIMPGAEVAGSLVSGTGCHPAGGGRNLTAETRAGSPPEAPSGNGPAAPRSGLRFA